MLQCHISCLSRIEVFETSFAMASRTKVAVCGAGIAGMSAAYHIAKHGDCEVTLYESEEKLGGHEMPVETKYGNIDLGFMVSPLLFFSSSQR